MSMALFFNDSNSPVYKRAITRLISLLFITMMSTSPALFARDILVLGDSISAAYGMELQQGWVALLQNELGSEYRVINASISGETTSGGRARLPQLLAEYEPEIVVIELGGNDGLQGHPLTTIRANLSALIELSQNAQAKVLLLGIRIPPNYGDRYTDGFFNNFQEVAKERNIPLVPFILEGIATVDELMQRDGIHPNEAGQPILLGNVLPTLQQLITAMDQDEQSTSPLDEQSPKI